MLDGLIFDVDGTLWDSTDLVAKAWNYVLDLQGDPGERASAPWRYLLSEREPASLPGAGAALSTDPRDFSGIIHTLPPFHCE